MIYDILIDIRVNGPKTHKNNRLLGFIKGHCSLGINIMRGEVFE